MVKSEEMTTVKVPLWFKEWIESHKGEDETLFEAWQRLSGSPHPREATGILSDEAAETMLERIEAKNSQSRSR